MPHRIKARLAELGKSQVDLIKELAEKGITVMPCDLSTYVNNVKKTPKAIKTLDECDKIIKKWEKRIAKKGKV